MNRKILIVVVVLALIAVLFLVFKNVSFTPIVDNKVVPDSTTADKVKLDPSISEQTLPLSSAPKDVAWAVFQKYLAYNKNQNLAGVKSVVYKVASVCDDPKTLIDCKGRMGSAYSYGSALKKEDFTNIWNDEKQIILSTNFWLESSKELDQYGRFRSIIFFVKGTDGEWKLLSFSPTKGGATNKGVASQEEVDARLIRYTEDNDKDGIADYQEECLDRSGDLSCVKTDPKLRDTNGNGLWDGVEALMK